MMLNMLKNRVQHIDKSIQKIDELLLKLPQSDDEINEYVLSRVEEIAQKNNMEPPAAGTPEFIGFKDELFKEYRAFALAKRQELEQQKSELQSFKKDFVELSHSQI